MTKLVSETTVTVASARHIGFAGWQILSMALPGGGSGVGFFPTISNPRQGMNGSIVPDLLAKNDCCDLLCFEAKPRPNLPDVLKLLQLKTQEFKQSLISTLGFEPRRILLGVGFGQVTKRDSEILKEIIELSDFGFKVYNDQPIEVLWDRFSLFTGSDINVRT